MARGALVPAAMSATKTAWHPPFTGLLQERCPKWVRVTGEVQLTSEPLRVDDLLEIWPDRPRDPLDEGMTLRALWRELRRVGLLEFKSVARAFRRGDLSRLFAYGALWLAAHQRAEGGEEVDRVERLAPGDVALILAVPSINRALRDELASYELELSASSDGYHRIASLRPCLIVADLSTIAEREDDDLLRWFAGRRIRTLEAQRWVRQHLGTRSDTMTTNATPDLEGYDEWVAQYVATLTPEQRLAGLAPEQRLAGLAPEQRLAGLAPEQRLAGLAPEQRLALAAQLSEVEHVLAMPDHLLRMLPASYLDTLPPEAREVVRRRLGR